MNLEGSNPVFGLNALGGSLNIRLKNGFSFQGVEAAVAGGSFGQVQGEFQFGRRSGNVAAYVAGSALHQNGWRDLQSSDIQNMYGDIGWRSPRAEVHFNVTAAHSGLNGPGTAPVQLLAAAPGAQFTAPNWIANSYAAADLSANVDLGDTLSLQALGYYRYFRQSVTNGNAPNDTPCADGSGLLCTPDGPSTTTGGGFDPRLPGRRAIRPARHAEHEHQCLRRQPAAHRHRQAAGPRQPSRRRGEPRRRTDAVRRDVVCRRPDRGRQELHRPRRGDRRARHQFARQRRRRQRRLGPLPRRHLAAHAAAGADGVGPAEHRDHHPQRSGGRRPQRLAQLRALQSRRRRDLRGRALAHALWRLRRRQPHADAGRTVLRRPVEFLQPRQFLRRRPRPQAGGVAHLRSRPAGQPSGLREGPPALQRRALPQRPRRRHRLRQQPGAGPRLLRQYRQHAPPGPRRRGAAHHRALARLCRLFLHRRHVPERSSKPQATIPPPIPTATSPCSRATGCPASRPIS